ncbi:MULTISPECIES: hypothetical protein [unclassified Variovorax]|uniref:hypothetical protein n=1 Tax=unclassified Variovorax TaxID=663243 RepID=UPI00076D8A33|nr:MULTISPECIES: hypothetical protein [unclassified Variovorax]KWT82840.1 hypothetical protein APY03_4702 [Variovorax sp. WDL1]PNG52429.1 hypothetical protein CHC07_04802 [Variovorax sp. B4]PNG54969.1 hypothetical protein CHC06_03768 [Variovorax sp. B2]VTV15990.1 hypothetical protein WDL1CHR_06342 [Variovorax sp. WDL1]
MSSAAATSLDNLHSSLQPLHHQAPERARILVSLQSVLNQTATRSVEIWNKLSRKTQILLVALSMTFSSFGLSMIVATLSR